MRYLAMAVATAALSLPGSAFAVTPKKATPTATNWSALAPKATSKESATVTKAPTMMTNAQMDSVVAGDVTVNFDVLGSPIYSVTQPNPEFDGTVTLNLDGATNPSQVSVSCSFTSAPGPLSSTTC